MKNKEADAALNESGEVGASREEDEDKSKDVAGPERGAERETEIDNDDG